MEMLDQFFSFLIIIFLSLFLFTAILHGAGDAVKVIKRKYILTGIAMLVENIVTITLLSMYFYLAYSIASGLSFQWGTIISDGYVLIAGVICSLFFYLLYLLDYGDDDEKVRNIRKMCHKTGRYDAANYVSYVVSVPLSTLIIRGLNFYFINNDSILLLLLLLIILVGLCIVLFKIYKQRSRGASLASIVGLVLISGISPQDVTNLSGIINFISNNLCCISAIIFILICLIAYASKDNLGAIIDILIFILAILYIIVTSAIPFVLDMSGRLLDFTIENIMLILYLPLNAVRVNTSKFFSGYLKGQ